jgi:hypothetical protein
MDLKEMECDEVERIHLGRDRDNWQAFMSMAINFLVPETTRDLFVS